MISAALLSLAYVGAVFVGEVPIRRALESQAIAVYKLAWRECEAEVREQDANKIEHGHCVRVRKPRRSDGWR